MSLAEELYRKSKTKNYDTPPLWLDISFAIIVSTIHIFYALHFTRFSLAYLHAKCEEKRSLTKWSKSKLYIKTISSYYYHKPTKVVPKISTALWTQFFFVRNVLRVLIFVLCWIVLILYITLSLNVLFEYLMACIVDYESGSFFALIVLPPFIFINSIIIQHIFFIIMSTWSISADFIADAIVAEKKENMAKARARKGSVHTHTNPYADDENLKDLLTSTPTLYSKSDENVTPSVDENRFEHERVSLKQTICSPYFVAVRWRLLVVCCSVLFTMIALPTMSFHGDDGLITDTFWLQLFLRYMLIAVTLWLLICFCLEIVVALYGRISSLRIYTDVNVEQNNLNEQTKRKKIVREILRFLCLMDVFGLTDTHIKWKRCKVLSITLILSCGILLLLIGWIAHNRLIWFMGNVSIVYYISNILITSKPNGIYYLWKGNVTALELDLGGINDDLNKLNIDSMSHAANMIHLKQHQLNRLLSRHISTHNKLLISIEMAQSKDGDTDNTEHDDKKDTDINANKDTDINANKKDDHIDKDDIKKEPDDNKKDNIDTNKNDGFHQTLTVSSVNIPQQESTRAFQFVPEQSYSLRSDSVARNEADVIAIFCKLHRRINGSRKKLYAQRAKQGCSEICRGSLCCCCLGNVKPLNFLLLINFVYCVFKEYQVYWLLILPYNYEMRPLSVCLIGGGAILEDLFKFDYKSKTCSATVITGFRKTWRRLRGVFCFVCTACFLLLMLWVSIRVNTSDENAVENITLNEQRANLTNSLDTLPTAYGVCDLRWNAHLTALDLVSLAHITHEVNKRDDIISLQDMVCLYFDEELSENMPDGCQWEIIWVSSEEPVFMHLRDKEYKTDVIAIRGTESNLDTLQDFNLFNQVALLQTASWIVPVTSLLPWSFIIQIVYFMSFFEGTIDTESRQRYDDPVFEYAYDFLREVEYEIDSLYFVGHSMGGAVGAAVASQLNHAYHAGFIINEKNKQWISHDLDLKSFSYGSPGLTFNSRKFSFDLTDLYATATVLKIRHDAISNVDVAGGFVQNVECSESKFYLCHKRANVICELGVKCGFGNSKNPFLVQSMCVKTIQGGKSSYALLYPEIYNLSVTYT